MIEAVAALFVIGGALCGGITVAAWYWSDDATVRRTLKASRRHAIADLPDGMLGRVVGSVAAGKTIDAPLSGRRCVYYRLEVDEKSGDTRRRVLLETAGVPFVVEDSTGCARVDPTHARVSLANDARTSSGAFDAATGREEEILRRHGVASRGLLLNKSLRYREAVIEVGETIAIAGHGTREIDPDASATYRDAAPTRVRLSGSRRYPLLISDKPDTWA